MPASRDFEAGPQSPYEHLLGRRVDQLHPRLRTYFSAIPAGSEGRGAGIFNTVGTPRRWLWPLWAVLAPLGVAFPGWHRGVPFTVRNIPDSDGGQPAVRAVRTFAFPSGSRWMVDRIGVDQRSGLLVDALGRGGLLAATFTTTVEDRALRLVSDQVWFAAGPLRIVLPRRVAPTITLLERFDDAREQQHVDVVIESPLVGRVYEYSGYFEYAIVPVKGTAASGTRPAD